MPPMIVYPLAQVVILMKVAYAITVFFLVDSANQHHYARHVLLGHIIIMNRKAACCHALWVHIMRQLQTFSALAVSLLVKLAKILPNVLVVFLIILYMMRLASKNVHLNSMQMGRVFVINAMDIVKLVQENIIVSLVRLVSLIVAFVIALVPQGHMLH